MLPGGMAMPSYVVYVDQVFVGSLVMNLAILWVTAKLGRAVYNRWRLLAGAILGALYSLFIFIPSLDNYLAPGYKFLVSVLMVFAAFLPGPPKKMFVLLAYFYLTTFALGGTVQGIINFLHRHYSGDVAAGVMQAVDAYLWYGILLALVLFWGLGRVVPARLKKRLLLPLLRADLAVCLGGRRTHMAAMLDTGNNLTDPFTGDPVVVAEYDALQDILPEELHRAVAKYGPEDGAAVLAELGEGIRQWHFRLIPYSSVGRERGWLVGFRPDYIELTQGGSMFRTKEAVIALYHGRLQADSPCRALFPPSLLENRIAA